MSVVNELCKDIKLPRMIEVRQKFDDRHISVDNIAMEVNSQLKREDIKKRILPGMSIAITCGSRGINNINIIIKAIVDFVKECGANPFVIPAMGSHGGATAEGQREILTHYDVTEEYIGCPIKASMKTVEIGVTEEGHHVLIDRYAANADGIIVAGRVKAHTAFRGKYESGLMKMMAIGLGKQSGAEVLHESGFKNMARLMPMFANTILDNANILCGLAIIENAYDDTYKLVGLTKEEIPLKEPELLEESKELLGRILFDEADILIVDEIGKNISGDGMDPNVTGTYATPYASGGLKKQRIVVLDLTEETQGNSNGIGLANITTKRLVDKINTDITFPNAITSTVLDIVKVPMYVDTDKEAIQLAIRSCNEIDKKNPRIIRIKNTAQLENIYISEAMLEEAKNKERIEIIGNLEEWKFNEQDNLW